MLNFRIINLRRFGAFFYRLRAGGRILIKLHRLGGQEININADLIESVTSIPNTLVALTTGNKLVVKESVEEVKDLLQAYRRETGPVSQQKSAPTRVLFSTSTPGRWKDSKRSSWVEGTVPWSTARCWLRRRTR